MAPCWSQVVLCWELTRGCTLGGCAAVGGLCLRVFRGHHSCCRAVGDCPCACYPISVPSLLSQGAVQSVLVGAELADCLCFDLLV